MKTLAALLIALPLAAAAQYEPAVPNGANPPSRRSPWYIGFGIGGGDGNVKDASGSYSFQQEHSALWSRDVSPTNVTLNFKVGVTLSPDLLVGFDLTGIRSQYDNSGSSTAIQATNYDAMLTWFPQGEGFFLRGGVGLTALQYSIDTPVGSSSDSASGTNVLAGLGYAFWLGQSANLTVNADYSIQRYRSNGLHIDSSDFFALWVGLDWY